MNRDGTQLCNHCGEESSSPKCNSCVADERQAREETAGAKLCPLCDGFIPNNQHPGAYPGALSRVDNKTEICSSCGIEEALVDFMSNT